MAKVSMTEREAAALRLHNLIFSQPASAVIRLPHLGVNRWHVIYADGATKWDYECGDAAKQLDAIMRVSQ